MNCEEVKDLLSAFQDRELEPGEMTAVEEHLKNCPECATQSTMLTNLSRIVQHWEGVRASERVKHELVEKVHRGPAGAAGRAAGPVALALLGLLAAALLGAGIVALALWYADRDQSEGPAPESRRTPPAAACVAVTGRVELVQPDGAVVDVRPPRELFPGQELRCDNGSAAQLELPMKPSGAALLLRGRGSVKFLPDETRLNGGTLVFHVPALKVPPNAATTRIPIAISAGVWKVMIPYAAVGLVELAKDGSVRLAVKTGEARLTDAGGKGGLGVAAGKEIAVDAGGQMSPPRPVANPSEFDLLLSAEKGNAPAGK